jgi:ABC-type tungstate transport system substrate-binding protein
MTDREYAVLNAVNVATTQWRRPGHDFEATAEQIAETLMTDERFAIYAAMVDGWPLSGRQVGATLGAMGAEGRIYGPLVERVDTRRWRLADKGLEVLIA